MSEYIWPLRQSTAWNEMNTWRLEVLRLATRETTVILYLDDAGRMREQIRRNCDSKAHPPTKLLFGVGTTSAASTATVLVDEIWLTESELSS